MTIRCMCLQNDQHCVPLGVHNQLMIAEIANFRNFREKLRHYLDQTLAGNAIAIKSKEREVVLISMEEHRTLTLDETEYYSHQKPFDRAYARSWRWQNQEN